MKALHIDFSISGGLSVSRQLTAGIIARLRQTTPGLDVTYRDLAAAPVPQQSPGLLFAKTKAMYEAGALSGDIAEMVGAAIRNGAHVDAATQSEFAIANAALDEFLAADIVVVGAPMYNFGIPSQLKAWIDCLAVAGKTFRYSASGVEGLAGGKRLIIGSSRAASTARPRPSPCSTTRKPTSPASSASSASPTSPSCVPRVSMSAPSSASVRLRPPSPKRPRCRQPDASN